NQSTVFRGLVHASLARFTDVDSVYLISRLLVDHFEVRCKYNGSNPLSKYQEVTSSKIAKDTTLQERARRFVKRELSLLQHDMAVRERDKDVQGVINVISSVDLNIAAGAPQALIHETLKQASRATAGLFVLQYHPL